MMDNRWIYAAFCGFGLAVPATADDPAPNTLPEDLRQALAMPDWFLAEATTAPDMLDETVQSLLAASDPALRDVDMDAVLALPLASFSGVLFGQVNRQLNPPANAPAAGSEFSYEIGDPLDAGNIAALQDAFRMTRCYVVSENDLNDGFATAFQFSENDEIGYSLSFVIFDYDGPGTYYFDETSLNYVRYAPSAVVGMVVATREIEGVATVVGQFTSAETGGSLAIRELPDGSMFGKFDLFGLGSTDRMASQDGAIDKYFISQFSGVFRTASLDTPVVVDFVPLPMVGGDIDVRTEPVIPADNVQVLARSGEASCPKNP